MLYPRKPKFSKTKLVPALWCRETEVPEVVGAFPLAEAAAGYDADARLLEELHAVKHVRGHLMGLWEQGRRRVRSWLCANTALNTRSQVTTEAGGSFPRQGPPPLPARTEAGHCMRPEAGAGNKEAQGYVSMASSLPRTDGLFPL